MLAWDRTCVVIKGLRDRNSPTCTLSQNGYGDEAVWLLQLPSSVRERERERERIERANRERERVREREREKEKQRERERERRLPDTTT